MNERIRELAKEADIPAIEGDWDYNDRNLLVKEDGEWRPAVPSEIISTMIQSERGLEKFAQLIVQETIKQMAIQMDKFGDDQSNNPTWYKSEEAVKKHFGVEESLGWVCSKCGTDRTKAVCPLGNSAAIDGRCPMVLTTK